MKLSSLALSALALLGLTQAQQPTFTNCAPAPTQFEVQTFAVAPYPLCINKIMCQTATGTLSTPVISGAKLSITARYLGRVVYSDNQDLCALFAAQGFPCPVPTTIHALTACVLVKPSIPANINIAMTFSATNGDGGILYCQTGTVMAVNCP
ncbi:hypothetical protein BGZ97_011178 [Linnemannia gamsii]|uniref:Phosphatidylglycerol/phosphatidylinositol transfer protein n=1 Tax=Linnemannia gamsii TaxID=64522 RepID=A0A9P6R8R5_9FUNG|nr:hypothetical protein BGZ97_011178 [Linnemannia gamsii]